MKRLIAVLLVMALVIPVIGYAENDVKNLIHQYFERVEVIPTEHILIIKADYDEVMNVENSVNVFENAQEYLKPYDFILFLLMKDESIYIAAQIFIHDGITDETANGLMSAQFIQDNIRLGVSNQ